MPHAGDAACGRRNGRRRAAGRPPQLYGAGRAGAALAAGPAEADADDSAGARGARLGPEAARGVAALMARAASLKEVARQGWIDKAGIGRPESVADHSYATALAAAAVGDCSGLDALRMVRMALLHDLAESITGDIVPGAMPAGRKAGIERAAMDRILGGLPEPLRGAYGEAWAEFEEGRTAEAAMVRELDKIEMAGQAAAYAGAGRPEGLAEIAESARQAVSSPAGRALLAEASRRGARKAGAERRPANGAAGGGGEGETIEAQRTVIGILFEVVRRLQANADLDGEYMGIVAAGRAEERRGRLAEIAAERSANSDAAARLLRRLEP